MTPEVAAARLSDIFGIDIPVDHAAEALKELATYHDLQFETLRGQYKMVGDAYMLLAVENTQMHNGAWVRYIAHLKTTQHTIIAQSVVNKRLYKWLLRNGFSQTKKHKDWLIWRSQNGVKS